MCVSSFRDNGEAAAYIGFNYARSATGDGGGGASAGGNGYGSLGGGGDRGYRAQVILSLTTLVLALIWSVRL